MTRTFDESMVALWKQGRGMGGTFSQRGHEAISVGAGYALAPEDVVAPMHRDLGCYLLRGMTPRRIFGNLLGRANGVTAGRDANLHGMGDLSLGIVGFISHLPHSLPVALGMAMSFTLPQRATRGPDLHRRRRQQRRPLSRDAQHGGRLQRAAGRDRREQPVRLLHAAGSNR